MHLHILVSLSGINCKNRSRVIPLPKHHAKVNRSSKGKGRRVVQKLMSTLFSLSQNNESHIMRSDGLNLPPPIKSRSTSMALCQQGTSVCTPCSAHTAKFSRTNHIFHWSQTLLHTFFRAPNRWKREGDNGDVGWMG